MNESCFLSPEAQAAVDMLRKIADVPPSLAVTLSFHHFNRYAVETNSFRDDLEALLRIAQTIEDVERSVREGNLSLKQGK